MRAGSTNLPLPRHHISGPKNKCPQRFEVKEGTAVLRAWEGSLFSPLHTCECAFWVDHLSLFSPTVLHFHFVQRANALSFVRADCSHERDRKKRQNCFVTLPSLDGFYSCCLNNYSHSSSRLLSFFFLSYEFLEFSFSSYFSFFF